MTASTSATWGSSTSSSTVCTSSRRPGRRSTRRSGASTTSTGSSASSASFSTRTVPARPTATRPCTRGASPNVLEGTGLIPLHHDDPEYPGFSTEVRACRGHHNAIGYSGTTGNAVNIHHNEWDHNSTGLTQDSFFPDHPGTPQNHALIQDNLLHSNNVDYYDQTAHRGRCADDVPMSERDYEGGAVCPANQLPVGSGIMQPGGNFDWIDGNRFYDDWRQGTFQFWVPAEIRQGGPAPDAHFRETCGPDGDQTCPFEENSHWNTYSGNRMAEEPLHGYVQPNGVDFTWDVEGEGNCWAQTESDLYRPNTSAAGPVRYQAIESPSTPEPVDVPFPSCDQRDLYSSASTTVTGSTPGSPGRSRGSEPPR